MSIRLPEHSHCMNCGDPTPSDEPYCSDECQREQEAKERRNRQRNLIFYIVAIVAIAAVWLFSYVL
ncbi:MAG TPA: DUF2116 family Zn-ribbon domain-containing protein [Methanomassiliicoccaceae archaeon]|jgi:predicted nucleic acid-binding Zn ribbon protein|nr:DUF2116 family Zn-ribbon domain-containing protein [Euryarchaeota archaeon]HOB39029.1 DUF2116 family Zn-ribbon domain-containing protein [Methanomassiliicoccaceae archaeon]HOK27611.1 DUF2116 family Zn-ribbon domain-containing protein [Methanomassiliicoccaceae archaeon]HOL08002.1 DUF2116 family Zn-ribbon domain-containing protein [Methanomassiliicoccaceae archaeon]HOQ25736.1 DUF2116 family Zn-ribbon domain-containing protein [Methanomassiliicoccaceae archaeon]